MTANSEKLAKLTKKIQALMAKTVENGASEAEALSAAEKVQELMNTYDLSMSDIEINTQEFVCNDIETKKSTVTAIHNMINAISNFTDTKAWFNRPPAWNKSKGIVYNFYGPKKDVEFAHFLFNLFVTAIEGETKRHQKSAEYKMNPENGKTKTNSFKIGMTTRLNQRLREIKIKRNTTNQQAGLVLYDKKALVEQKYVDMIGGEELCTCYKNKERIEEGKKPLKYKDCCGKMKTESRKTSVGSYDSYFAGKAAGDTVNITTGLGGNGASKALNGR